VTSGDRPDLDSEASTAFRDRWPEFVFHDSMSHDYIARVEDYFRDFSILVLHEGRVVAGSWGVPFVWDGDPDELPEGYRTALAASVESHESGRAPTAFSFMAAAVARDPWIRTHQRMGAQILKPAPNSMVVSGTVSEWESWAGMSFPASGQYVVPEALNLVAVDRENDVVSYCEENLWVRHR